MLREHLLPQLTARYPGKFVIAEPGVEPCVTFPAIHPDVGDLEIYDDGDEMTIVAGKITHGHFSNFDDVPIDEKERSIVEDVLWFLDKMFTDQVVLRGSHERGSWHVIDESSPRCPKLPGSYVWSGPWLG